MSYQGLVILSSARKLAAVAKQSKSLIYLLPNRLRLIRTTLSDNGFNGVRTVTSDPVFQKDLQVDAQTMAQVGNSVPDSIPDNFEEEGHPEVAVKEFGTIKEGEYMTVSPGLKLKYLVCHPNHCWALGFSSDGILVLVSVSKATAKKAFEKTQVVETAFASFC